ncbi:sodium-dependent transporter [Streptacidiphilus monticola]|uniref:Sodium-dependent transporter n=1 Tax=Streptacidiphilus monticola TaxID=2161674 RepID=A0ABW1FZ40_9ACTN
METWVARLQRRLLWVLLGAYVLAALAPGPGLALRAVDLARLDGIRLPLPAALLGLMLFNAGLTARVGELSRLARAPSPLLAGVLSNALLPTLLLALVAVAAPAWHSSREAQSLLVGLVLVGAIPVAGGATAFAQSAEGNTGLSLGLVLASTLLSPLTVPLGLHLGGFLAEGSWGRELHAAAGQASSAFAVLAVVLPCLLGLLTGRLLPPGRALPLVRSASLAVTVLLSYTNACGALRQVVAHPDVDFLLLVLAVSALVCGCCFLSGWALAARLGVPHADAVALTYASGMNNSSAGAVLAATRLPGHPAVLLPILAYSLLQKVMAGAVGAFTATRHDPVR